MTLPHQWKYRKHLVLELVWEKCFEKATWLLLVPGFLICRSEVGQWWCKCRHTLNVVGSWQNRRVSRGAQTLLNSCSAAPNRCLWQLQLLMLQNRGYRSMNEGYYDSAVYQCKYKYFAVLTKLQTLIELIFKISPNTGRISWIGVRKFKSLSSSSSSRIQFKTMIRDVW